MRLTWNGGSLARTPLRQAAEDCTVTREGDTLLIERPCPLERLRVVLGESITCDGARVAFAQI